MLKSIYELIDSKILYGISKMFPSIYRFYTSFYDKFIPYINLIKYKDKYFFYSVAFEISTYCNRKCWYCPNVDNETPKEFMPWEIFEKAIEELKSLKYSGVIVYHLYNEPLYDERLVEFIKYTKQNLPKALTILNTNGDLLTLEKAKELVNSGLDKIVATVHDKNPDRNLERLKPVKELLKSKMILQSSNDLYLENRGGEIDISKSEKKLKELNKKRCNTPIKGINIRKNGDIILCCNDYYSKHVMGNIMNDTILNIYYSPFYKNIREKLLINNEVILPICKKCLGRE